MQNLIETTKGKSRRGFASMDRSKRQAIASLGGKACQAQGVAHRFTVEEAREAGRKGGTAKRNNRLATRQDLANN